jgi:hypothetical protein
LFNISFSTAHNSGGEEEEEKKSFPLFITCPILFPFFLHGAEDLLSVLKKEIYDTCEHHFSYFHACYPREGGMICGMSYGTSICLFRQEG